MYLYELFCREEITRTVYQLSEAISKVAEQDKTIDGLRSQLEDSKKEFMKAIDEKDSLVTSNRLFPMYVYDVRNLLSLEGVAFGRRAEHPQ